MLKAIRFITHITLFFAFFSTFKFSFAARRAKITENEVPVFSDSNAGSEEIATIDKIEITTSNEATSGFYKVRLPDNSTGWISEDYLEFTESSESPDLPRKNVETSTLEIDLKNKKNLFLRSRTRGQFKNFKIKTFGGIVLFDSQEINQHFGLDVLKTGSFSGLSAGFQFTRKFSILLRGEWIFSGVIGRDLVRQKVYDFSLTSFPILLGFELALSEGRRFWSELSIMGGIAYRTELHAHSMYDSEPNITSIGANPFVVKGLLSVGIIPVLSWNWFSIYAEAGYQYLKTPSLRPYQAGYGYELFAKNGDFVELPIQLSGPVLAGGLNFRF